MNKATFHKTDFFVADTSAELSLEEDGSVHIIREFSAIQKLMKDLANQKKPVKSWINRLYKNPADNNKPLVVVIPLTYRCNNICDFKCVSNSIAALNSEEINKKQVMFTIDLVYNKYNPAILIFTGGDPLLRNDILSLIEYAAVKGMKTGIISNGMKCSDMDFVRALAGSGLDSARINLESHKELVHNTITGNIESFKKTVSGIYNLSLAGITAHTNTTICRWNMDHLTALAEFIYREFRTGCMSISVKTDEKSNNNNKIILPVDSSHFDPVLHFCRESSVKLILNATSTEFIYNIFNSKISNIQPRGNSHHPVKRTPLADETSKLIKTKIKKDIDKNELIWKIFL